MIIICEECGKKYRIDVTKIKGAAARFKCRVCTHMITVAKPTADTQTAAATDLAVTETVTETAEKQKTTIEPDIEVERVVAEQAKVTPVRKRGAFNLRSKMLLLFLVVPLALMIGASFLYLRQLEQMSGLLTQESTKIVNQMAEDKIADLSTAVAIQCRLYLLVCTPVAGTPFVIAATTYLDEFTGPIKLLETQARMLTEKARLISWAVLGGTLLLIGIIVSIYSHRLTGKIKSLTDVAERISIGDLGIEVETRARDEIGELAEAISRMQDSIRLSIERLRRRR